MIEINASEKSINGLKDKNIQNKVGVYFKVLGLAKNYETGEKTYAGGKIEFGGSFENPHITSYNFV